MPSKNEIRERYESAKPAGKELGTMEDGACFGWYDASFAECLECRASEPCRNATESTEHETVRDIPKTSPDVIARLVAYYSMG